MPARLRTKSLAAVIAILMTAMPVAAQQLPSGNQGPATSGQGPMVVEPLTHSLIFVPDVRFGEVNGEFGKALDHELESVLGASEAETITPEEAERRLQRAAKVSVHVHNRGEVDKPTDFNFDAMHAWHDSVRKQIAEAGGGPISDRQLEIALARAIKEVYAEKFEKMIEQVLEKTILKEIERLKKLVTGDE